MHPLDTQNISRLSRKDLQSLYEKNDSDNDLSSTKNNNSINNKEIEGGDKKEKDNYNDKNNDDADDDELDDFSLHNLRDLKIDSPSLDSTFSKPNALKDQELASNSSSSAASTVIHNPNVKSDTNTNNLVNSISLKTLESDPELQNKLHRTIRLSNQNLINQEKNQLNNDQESTSSASSVYGDAESEFADNDNDNDNNNSNNNNSIDGIDYYQNIQDNKDNDNFDNSDAHKDEDEDDDSNSFDSVEDLTDDKLTVYIEGMLPSPPSSPPRELDPTKLYALYDFSGPDPSHLPLLKNDSVLLLNDSDSYWWLVRKVDNNRIGFAPAEILETYSERLARLNCWKNEILERGGYKGLKFEDEKKLFKTDYPMHHPLLPSNDFINESVISIENTSNVLHRKGSLKRPTLESIENATKKTVSFADINDIRESSDVEFQERDKRDNSNSTSDNDETNASEASYSVLDGYENDPSIEDNINDVNLTDKLKLKSKSKTDKSDNEPDDASISSSNSTQPLVIPKKRRNFLIKNLDEYNSSEEKITSKQKQQQKPQPAALDILKARSLSPDSSTPSSSANANSLESTPTKIAKNNITTSTCYESTDSLNKEDCVNNDIQQSPQAEIERDESSQLLSGTPQLNILKTRSINKTTNTNHNETRLASLKMLDDLLDTYPEFVNSNNASTNTSTLASASASASNTLLNLSACSRSDSNANLTSNSATTTTGEEICQGLAEGYHPESSQETHYHLDDKYHNDESEFESVSEFSKSKNSLSSFETVELHPKTALIFDPLFNQMKQLDALLDEIQK